MKTKIQTIFLLLTLTGCAAYADLEKDYSKSYYQAMTGQILNPEASKNLSPVVGLPGDAAAASMEKYTKSFSRDPNKPGVTGLVIPAIPKEITGGRDGY